MKIICKTKDYYDHCQGKFGVDPKLVYDRRDGKPYIFNYQRHWGHDYNRDSLNNDHIVHIHINGVIYPMIYVNHVFMGVREVFSARQVIKNGVGKSAWVYHDFVKHFDKYSGAKSNVNAKLREPVIVESVSGGLSKEPFKPVLLSDYNFYHVMSPEKAWIEISSFLGWLINNPPIPDTQTNKGKILSHGFDLKQSFRHRK